MVVGNGTTDEGLFAARRLTEQLRARYGMELDVVRERDVGDPTGQIVMGEPGSAALLDRLLQQAKFWVTAASPGPEGYVLQVTRRQIVVVRWDRPGTFYALQTLRQLLRPVPAPAGHQSGPVPDVRAVT